MAYFVVASRHQLTPGETEMSEQQVTSTIHDEDLADEALDDRGARVLPSVNPCNVLSVGCRADSA
jgi:hypothetical protein